MKIRWACFNFVDANETECNTEFDVDMDLDDLPEDLGGPEGSSYMTVKCPACDSTLHSDYDSWEVLDGPHKGKTFSS